MDLAVYVAAILIYAVAIVWFALRISRRKKRKIGRPAGADSAAERSDLIDPTSLFRMSEEDYACERLLGDAFDPDVPDALADLIPCDDGLADAVFAGPAGVPGLCRPQEPSEAEIRESLLAPATERPEPAPPAAEGPSGPETAALTPGMEELVIETLLRDNFGTLLEFIRAASEEEILLHLPRVFDFRDDERFVLAVSELLAHREPAVQAETRRLIEGTGDTGLLDELVSLSVNQSHRFAELSGESPADESLVAAELGGLSSEQLLDRVRQETGTVASRRGAAAGATLSSPAAADFRCRIALARIGAAFQVNRGGEYLKLMQEGYERKEMATDLYEAAADDNEFVRGKALLRLGGRFLTARAIFTLRERLTSDPAPHVRACAAEGLSLYARRAIERNLVASTREIRGLVLAGLLAETDAAARPRIEAALYAIEHAPGMPGFTPLPMPEAVARFAMKKLERRATRKLLAQAS